MALHPNFPKSPYEVLDPDIRWFPADEDLRTQGYEKLLPPLVAKLRREVFEWRKRSYEGASDTSKALLKWWFYMEHFQENSQGAGFNFQYYFAQQEAVETIIYLYEILKAKDQLDLLKFDSSGAVSTGMFPESWRRYVIKMATGSGKTKVLSLILAWCYFHKLYEAESDLAQNFLIITPNIIVLDRIRSDFDGLKIFNEDPILPDDDFEGRDWQSDFQITLHIQDDLRVVNKTGNIFLTNIHRVFESSNKKPSFNDVDTSEYFLGAKPVTETNQSKVSLDSIVRDVDELIVFNDEAHHIHDERLAWFKSIEDIHNRLKLKDKQLSLQVDFTATPKHNNGSIFIQTVSDYPLVEAIYQGIVKKPIVPDEASRAKLKEKQTIKFVEKYEDHIHLGYLEWKKTYEELAKSGKKSVLFVMTDDTRNCDEVKEYLENSYSDLKGNVLVIHTKNNGEITEIASGKGKEELEKLRKDANEIDNPDNTYKAIVSVLMLKEGWDVKNVTTIVGLRAYSAKSNILPEQTLGRGLRRMFRGDDISEVVSVIGTSAFIDFVESIKSEGVELERKKMGEGTPPKSPIVVEIDRENLKKDISKLEIEIPVLSPRIIREYKNLSEIDTSSIIAKPIEIKEFSEAEKREIVFRYVVEEKDNQKSIHHTTELDFVVVSDYHNAIGFFANSIKHQLRLISGYDVLYGKVKQFIEEKLFGQKVDLNDLNIVRNLSEPEATKIIIEGFKKKINDLTVVDKGEAEIQNYIKVSNSRPFVANDQSFYIPKKSPFNKIIGDSHFELEFANFLDNCGDVLVYAKNYFAVNFRIDYQNADGEISNYYPDFIVKVSDKEVWIVEIKGNEDLDDPLKIKRLAQWCEDINQVQRKVKYDYLYVKQEDFIRYKVDSLKELMSINNPVKLN